VPGHPSPNRIPRAALALTAALLSGVMAELALRLAPAGMVVEADLYRMSDGLLLLRPGMTRRHVTRQWDVTLRINGEGFRDFEREPRENEIVVLGLGDSQAFGWGVELEETFYSRVEAALAPRVRLIKAAVPGTGATDQARLLEWLAPAYRPRAVVLALFVGNDFVDVARGGSAQYDVVGGFLAHRGEAASGPGALRRLAIRSRLLQLLRAAQFRLGFAPEQERRWDAWMREYAQIHLADPPPETDAAYAETLAALDTIEDDCRRSGAKLLLVVLPRSFQVDRAELQEMLRQLGWSRDEIDLDRPQRILAEWAGARGVAYADVLPAFRRHAENGGIPLFYTPDAHMTAAGHAAAATAVEPALADLLIAIPPG
jgi:lysophospholipase L1-like esterase